MRKLFYSLLICTSFSIFADENESGVENTNAGYIRSDNFIQNPYRSIVSGGGTRNLNESQIQEHNFAEKLFYDGTWNVEAGASAQYTSVGAGYPNYAYGLNLFGQTGRVGGFSEESRELQ